MSIFSTRACLVGLTVCLSLISSRRHHLTFHSIPSDKNCTSYSYEECPLALGCQSVIRRKHETTLSRSCQFLSKASPSYIAGRKRWNLRFWLKEHSREDKFGKIMYQNKHFS